MKHLTRRLLFIATLVVMASAPSFARDGRHGGHHGGGHGRSHGHRHGGWHGGFHGGIIIGGPIWHPWHPYPYAYYPPYPPRVVIQEEPPVYVQQEPEAEPVADGYWYFCESAWEYYPRIADCPEDWIKVPPRQR